MRIPIGFVGSERHASREVSDGIEANTMVVSRVDRFDVVNEVLSMLLQMWI